MEESGKEEVITRCHNPDSVPSRKRLLQLDYGRSYETAWGLDVRLSPVQIPFNQLFDTVGFGCIVS